MGESGCPKKDDDEKFYTKDEILKHSSKDSLWIIFDGRVIDLTEYLDLHPGGSALMRYAGKDATCAIRALESHAFSHHFIEKKIDECCIGRIKD
uniref:Cytochrome b5 heme-binding domain-containing protein n=1 Tax=Panagrolaimus sp. ES5 TaxID=591445 RepID=A0AC34GBR7_9BILA